jgi:SAM-dependent methyltransferase
MRGVDPTSYQHPLAYLLGVEGAALLRGYTEGGDRESCEARIAEIRRLLDSPALAGDGVVVEHSDTVDGYGIWSASYDEPGNGLFAIEEPIVGEILDGLLDPQRPGTALDAACGTGRHAAHLVERGYRVIGVDSSPDMLALARERAPRAVFEIGELHRLPVPDDHVDLAVCALALTHVPDLGPVFAEFARVLRPGGHLVVTDVHQERVALGSVPTVRLRDGRPARMPASRHRAGDYLAAALPAGLQVRRCVEPRDRPTEADRPAMAGEIDPGPWEAWPWSLVALVPAAFRAAAAVSPVLVVWHFQLAPG